MRIKSKHTVRVIDSPKSGKASYRVRLINHNKTVYCESLLERCHVIYLDLFEQVESITTQPFTIQYVDRNGKTRLYTPDISYRKNGKEHLIEVKPKAKVEEFLRSRPEIKEIAAHAGAVFLILDDTLFHSRSPAYESLLKLKRWANQEVDPIEIEELVAWMKKRSRKRVSLQSLFKASEKEAFSWFAVLKAIGQNVLTFELSKRLTLITEVTLA